MFVGGSGSNVSFGDYIAWFVLYVSTIESGTVVRKIPSRSRAITHGDGFFNICSVATPLLAEIKNINIVMAMFRDSR